jgi:hypothetical protein
MYPSIKQAYIFKLIQFEYHDNRYAQNRQSVKRKGLRQEHKIDRDGVGSPCTIVRRLPLKGAHRMASRPAVFGELMCPASFSFFAFQNQRKKNTY